jgi:hypothetical protein
MSKAGNFEKYRIWTRGEMELLDMWIKENPTVKLSYATANPSLASLFPNRSATALYS